MNVNYSYEKFAQEQELLEKKLVEENKELDERLKILKEKALKMSFKKRKESLEIKKKQRLANRKKKNPVM